MSRLFIENDKRKTISYVAFSILFAISINLGRRVYESNKVGLSGMVDILLFILLTLLTTGFVYLVIWGLGRLKGLIISKGPRNHGKFFDYMNKPFEFGNRWIQLSVFALIIFIFWLPCFLSYYPMMDSYDIFYKTPYWFQQHSQALTGDYINRHPVLHTYFWSLAIKTGDFFNTLPFVPYALGQMLVLSIVFSKVIVFINQKGLAKIWSILTLLFYIIPVNAIFSLIPTKDVSLAPVLLLLVLNLYCMFSKDKEYNPIIGTIVAIVEALLCCLLRQNFIYAFLVFSILIFFIQKKVRKKIAIVSMVVFLSFYLITGPLFTVLNVKPGLLHEALCVPIEQMANALIEGSDNLSETEIEEIKLYFPRYDMYNPRFADPIKDNMNDELLNNNKINFIKLWIKVGLKCPKEYINAFLSLNIPYWYIGASPLDPYSEREYIETGDFEDHEPLISKALLEMYEKEGDFEGINSLPLIRFFFSLALPLWLLIFSIFKSIADKNKVAGTVLTLLLLFMLTFLLGPVSCMRYIYPIFVAYPFIFACGWFAPGRG